MLPPLLTSWRWDAADYLQNLNSKKNRCGEVATASHSVREILDTL